MSDDEQQRLMIKLAEQKLKNSYQFNETFDGTGGEIALKFRREMNDYYHSIKTKLGSFFDEQMALQNIQAAFCNVGKQHIKRDEARKAKNFYEFMIWFDKTYDLTGLRKSLYKQLCNWTIDQDTAVLSIVEIYQTRVDLFDATENVSTDDVVNSTKLDTSTKINSILNAIKKEREDLWDVLKILIYTKGNKPNTMDDLKTIIKHAHDAQMSITSNNNNKSKKDPTIVDNTVNAINMRQFPALAKPQKQYQNYNFYKPKTNDNNNYKNNQNSNSNYNANNNSNKKKIFRHKFDIPGYLNNYCNSCKKWGHFASDCKRIHSNKHIKLVDYYMSLRPNGKPANKPIVNNINVTQMIDDNDEDHEVIIEPTNEIENVNDDFIDQFQM